jgi:hypothetical protein
LNWDAIGAISELVGAVAVLVTLVYLAVQVRDNTKTVKSENVHRVTDSFNAINMLVASDQDLADLWFKGVSDFEALTPTEQARFGFVQLAAFRIYDSLYYQVARSTGDEQLWLAELDTIRWIFAYPGMRAWWRQQKFGFSAQFKEYIDGIVSELSGDDGEGRGL